MKPNPSLWTQLREQLADAKDRLAHLERQLELGHARYILVRTHRVRAHVRAAHQRLYYPPRTRRNG